MNSIDNIFNTYYNPLCNYVTKIVKDNFVAEDLVQSLFIELWEKNKFATIENPERFLLRSAKFKSIDFIRKQKKLKELPLDHNQDFPEVDALDLGEDDIEPLLHYFASKLPLKTREVFLLSRSSRLSYAEIAQEQKISIKTVESHMSKALKAMRSLLNTHDFLFALIFFDF